MKYKTRATRADEMPERLIAPEPQSKLSIHMVTIFDSVVVVSEQVTVTVNEVPADWPVRSAAALVCKLVPLMSK